MNPRALMLPAVPLLLAGLGWWGAGQLQGKVVKAEPAPVVTPIVLPPGIESLAPAGPRPPLGYLELAAFGFAAAPPKPVVVKPRVPGAADLYVVESVLRGSGLNTATIGNKTYKAGDKLDNRYTVLAVLPDGVWVLGSRKGAKKEKIGFRPYVLATDDSPGSAAGQPVASVAAPAAKAASDAASGSTELRDFRQILDMLKL